MTTHEMGQMVDGDDEEFQIADEDYLFVINEITGDQIHHDESKRCNLALKSTSYFEQCPWAP